MKLQELREYQYGPDIIDPNDDPERKFTKDPIDFRGAVAVGANGATPSDTNRDTNTNEPEGHNSFVVDEEEETVHGEFTPKDDSIARNLAVQFVNIGKDKGNPFIATKLAKNFYKKIIAHIDGMKI